MSDLISKRELYHKLGESYNKGYLSWGANEIIKDIIGECDSVENKGDLISRQAVENITWEEPSYSDPLNVLTEVREKSVTVSREQGRFNQTGRGLRKRNSRLA